VFFLGRVVLQDDAGALDLAMLLQRVHVGEDLWR
jgi:hypothetical protein